MAVLAPYHGTLLFAYVAALAIWTKNGFRALNHVDLFVLMPLWALAAAPWCCLLVIPTGYVAQRVMRWAAAEDDLS